MPRKPRKIKPGTTGQIHLSFLIEADLVRQLDEVVTHINGTNPGPSWTRTDLIKKALTEFVADQKSRMTAPSGALPNFFRALCAEAASGGTRSYADAGYELMRHIVDVGPYDLGYDEWMAITDKLDDLLREEGTPDEKVVAWFEANLPRCIALVPAKRHTSFVQGVRRRFEHRENGE
jgi:hypothetical protein